MNKKKKNIFYIMLLLIVLLIVFIMCAPETSSGGGSNNDTSIKHGVEDTTNWNKKIDGISQADKANSVAIDSNNNVYVVGYGTNLISGSSNEDWWIKKFDSSGNEDTTNWNKKIDGNNVFNQACSVAVDSNNNVYVVGHGYNLDSGSSLWDWWIKKFDSNGNEDTSNWNKIFDGNLSRDDISSIAIDSNNNVYIVGYGDNIVSGITGYDWWIKKFYTNGAQHWNIEFDGNGGDDIAMSVAIDSSDNIYVVGYGENIVTGITGYDWWIKKFNSSGNEDTTNWDKKIDSNFNDEVAYSAAIDSSNNVYVVGYGENIVTGITGYDWWIKKFDSSGNEDTTNWDKKIDNNYNDEVANSVAIDSNNNVYVVGYGTNLISGSSNEDWWIKKFDSNGNEDTSIWNKMFDGNDLNDKANSIAIDSNNNVYVVGYGYYLLSTPTSSNEDWWIKKFLNNN